LSFKSFFIPFQDTQDLIKKSLNKKQLYKMLDVFEKENNNPVNVMIYSNNNFLLKAKISCKYKIENFKEDYRQIPIIESKLSFIKRLAKKIHKYNESLCKMQ